jgi:hypothetical protein
MHLASIRIPLAVLVFVGAALCTANPAQAAAGAATIGQTVTFSVTADGTFPFTYQWYKDGSDITGATGGTYSISSVQLTDAGTYSVVVTNSAGFATSDGAILTVSSAAVAPSFTTRPASQTVTTGASVTFTTAASGSPAPTYQWRKNGIAISGATAASYTIAGVVAGDAGTYTALATNSAGSATSNGAVLTVNPATSAPVFTLQPTSKTVTVGASVTFTAAASGLPAPTYQWRKNGANISGATAASYTIASVVAGDAGTYTVLATNSAGSATSNGAVLTVNPATSAPVFTLQPISRNVEIGDSVTFVAAASGTPTPTYQWKKNGRSISGATSASYTIASVATGNAGTYAVVATNSAGSATSNGAVLTVTTSAPKFTVQPASWTVTTGASVMFTAAASGSPTPTYQWRKNGKKISGATRATYTIAQVTNSNAATYSVVATNSVGSATSSNAQLKIVSATSIVGVDFNLDGRADLLWQNTTSGERSIWLMNGTAQSSVVSLGAVGTDWSIAGIGDFNNDGNPDILWQNAVTGEISIGLMNRTTQSSVVSLGVVSTDWSMAGAGDFNSDNHPDILWENTATGERSIWLMNGTTKSSVVSLGVVSTDWSMAGAGDFNADGHPDILWQNTATGERSIWLMSATTLSSVISLGVISTDWSIAGTGDFNADGHPDILWENSATGERSVWLMSGTARSSIVSLGVVSTDWQIRN